MTSIYALSSAHGKAGVAVIRLSGPQSADVLHIMAGGVPEPRVARLRTIRNPENGETLDRGLVLWFPAPASFTGEDMAELHIHGGRAVLEAVLAALAAITGLRMAEPGEFARRAFENGKLDLTAAEGLADLIDAETEAQRRQAVRQAGGALRTLYEGWRRDVIGASASVEAALDFSDEADVPEAIAAQARPAVQALAEAIADHLADARGGEILREGYCVVIAGPPNAGKSSLLNALARRDAAIVSAEAGTTRDVVEVRLNLGGYPVVLMDTAGIREARGDVEREGIRRSLDRMREADLVLWVEDLAAPQEEHGEPLARAFFSEVDPGSRRENAAELKVRAPLRFNRSGKGSGDAPLLRVGNKADLVPVSPTDGMILISARTGMGLDRLLAVLLDRVGSRVGGVEGAAITRARHRQGLQAAKAALDDFLQGDPADLELRAEDLRNAATALGRLTGRVDVEDILDRIFADFCIGK